MTRRFALRLAAAVVSVVLGAAACGGDSDEPLDRAEATSLLDDLVGEIDWEPRPVARSASIPPPNDADLADVLPPIHEFPIVVSAPPGAGEVVEIFVSTEKSGEETNGWMVEVAEAFNREGVTLSDGSEGAVEIRRIASGIGYQFIARGEGLPEAFSPSNELWIEMAAEHQPMTQIRDQTVANVAGIVMKSETADQLRADGGELDAFVMEYQTFATTDSLRSGFEFIPFGVRHDNPLYAVGDVSDGELEVLERFAEFSATEENQAKATEFGFDPPAHDPVVVAPSGSTLIDVQEVWKEKKDGGRPVATVFVVDVSGSMHGTRIQALQTAMLSAREFIKPETRVGVVEFNDLATRRLDVGEFDLNQQGRFVALAEDLDPRGGTAMYDGVVLGLSMLGAEVEANPELKPLLVVLTDGATTEGLTYAEVDEVIEGVRIPVFTVGFEADLDELGRLSSLVEAASIDASEADVEFKIAALFNAGG